MLLPFTQTVDWLAARNSAGFRKKEAENREEIRGLSRTKVGAQGSAKTETAPPAGAAQARWAQAPLSVRGPALSRSFYARRAPDRRPARLTKTTCHKSTYRAKS